MVELLVEYTDQLDMADRDGLTAAHVAALNGEVRCLQTLYDKGTVYFDYARLQGNGTQVFCYGEFILPVIECKIN